MTPPRKQNIGHSVFQRLLNRAKDRREDFNFVLLRYGVERLLYRLGASPYAGEFILKGASLFLVWKGQGYRVTKDTDLLGFGSAEPSRISNVFKGICRIPCEEDGMVFMPDTVRATPVRQGQEYEGVRVTLTGMLYRARIQLQVDIGFGDVVTPAPEGIEFPTLLDAHAPRLRAYSRYTMVAEKFEAMVRLGLANSRMKDFYDVWLLSRLFEFEGLTLCDAVRNTFRRRTTSLPDGLPTAFTEEFRQDPQKQTQWQAFIRKARPEPVENILGATVDGVAGFLMPVVAEIRGSRLVGKVWEPGGQWK